MSSLLSSLRHARRAPSRRRTVIAAATATLSVGLLHVVGGDRTDGPGTLTVTVSHDGS